MIKCGRYCRHIDMLISWEDLFCVNYYLFENYLFSVAFLQKWDKKLKVSLFFKEIWKLEYLKIKLRQKVGWDPQIIYNLSQKLVFNLLANA